MNEDLRAALLNRVHKTGKGQGRQQRFTTPKYNPRSYTISNIRECRDAGFNTKQDFTMTE